MVGHLPQGVSSHGDRLLTVTGAERDPLARLAGEAGSPSDSVLDPRSGDQRALCLTAQYVEHVGHGPTVSADTFACCRAVFVRKGPGENLSEAMIAVLMTMLKHPGQPVKFAAYKACPK